MNHHAPSLTRRSALGFAGAAIAVSGAVSAPALAQAHSVANTSANSATGGFNVKWFGAQGDSDLNASGGSDDTQAIQSAIEYVRNLGGGTIYFPEGCYKITSYLKLCPNLRIVGSGSRGAYIIADMVGGGGSSAGEATRNGTAFYSGSPSNSSTNASIVVEHIGMVSTDPSNVGAAFYDNCGTYIQLQDCYIAGFKYGVIFDQSELADVDGCHIELQNNGGAAVYIVNGPTLTPGNLTTVTNRISVKRCQINEAQSTYGILDEGGYTHSFIDNNYNGCLNHLYLAGTEAFQVIGGEFEACAGPSIVLEYRRVADGGGVGGSCGYFMGMMNSPGDQPCVKIVSSAGPFVFIGNLLLRTGGAVPIVGGANASALHSYGNFVESSTGELADSCYGGYIVDDRVEMVVRTNSALANLDLNRSYARKFVRCIGPSANGCTVQTDANEPLPLGSTFTLEQSTAKGIVILSTEPGVALAGPTKTSAQYQKLIVRKVAPNSWVTELVTQNPLTQPITPMSVAATGAITSSNGGLGYASGAGGTAVQSISKSAQVVLNKLSGQITLNDAQLAPATPVSFLLKNSQIAAGDVLILNHVSGGTAGVYALNAHGATAGSATIDVTNISTGPLSEPIVIAFVVIKAVIT